MRLGQPEIYGGPNRPFRTDFPRKKNPFFARLGALINEILTTFLFLVDHTIKYINIVLVMCEQQSMPSCYNGI